MQRAAVLAIGDDQRGIVARLTQVISDRSLNIEVSRMATLSDQFSMMLIVQGDAIPAGLKDDLEQTHTEGSGGLRVWVKPLSGKKGQPTPSPSHVVTVYAPEKVGVIRDLSAELASRPINITHLHSQVLTIQSDHGPKNHCVTRAFVNMDGAEMAELEQVLRIRLELPGEGSGGDVRVEPVVDV